MINILCTCIKLWGFPKSWGYPNSWMVCNFTMENTTKMDENCGYPYFRKPPKFKKIHCILQWINIMFYLPRDLKYSKISFTIYSTDVWDGEAQIHWISLVYLQPVFTEEAWDVIVKISGNHWCGGVRADLWSHDWCSCLFGITW